MSWRIRTSGWGGWAAPSRRPSRTEPAVGPHPAVAATRLAVRRCLAGEGGLADGAEGQLGAGDLVLVACPGGADSLALAAALAFEAPKAGLRAGGVVIDHGLQPGSAEVAES